MKQFHDELDDFTRQVRLYATTGQSEHEDLYFEKADVTKRNCFEEEDIGKKGSGLL